MRETGAGPRGHGWAFIDLAALGVNSWWSYAATLMRIVLLPLVFTAVCFAGIFIAGLRRWLPAIDLQAVLLATGFAAVIVIGLALIWGVTRSHRRPWRSLISTDLRLDWRRLAIGAGVEGALLSLLVCVGHWAGGQPWPPGPKMPLAGVAALMLLVPFQAASEEMLFRGYLTQALGRLVRSRVAIAVAVGLVFGALHMNAYGALTIPYLLVLSLTYSLASLRDERLELTIGAHAATNWFAVGASDVLSAAHGGVQLAWPMLAGLVVNGAIFYAATRLLVRLLCERGPAA